MAGKQFAKHKTIAVYDYFSNRVGSDEKNSVTLETLKAYLSELFGDEFERKSIYSDIAVINEYKRYACGITGDWIELKGRNGYVRNTASDEFTMDEIHLLLDAVNATPIADDNIAGKIKKNWPMFFDNDDYVSFMACERQKPTRAFVSLMNTIRKAIRHKTVLKIRYGYKLTDRDPGNCLESERLISPLALYFEENKYYLFAIDNVIYGKCVEEEQGKGQALKKSLRQFRIDRISNKIEIREKDAFIDCDESVVKNKISGAVDAYSEGRSLDLEMTMEGEPELLIKAFNYLRSELNVKGIINDNWNNGKLSFFISVDPSPRFFSFLTNLSSFDDDGKELKIRIGGDRKLQEAYRAFLEKAAGNVDFFERS